MTKWTDPRYAALVARYQEQQENPDDVPPIGLAPHDSVVPARRGFIMEPVSHD